jgi:hypothetical protein
VCLPSPLNSSAALELRGKPSGFFSGPSYLSFCLTAAAHALAVGVCQDCATMSHPVVDLRISCPFTFPTATPGALRRGSAGRARLHPVSCPSGMPLEPGVHLALRPALPPTAAWGPSAVRAQLRWAYEWRLGRGRALRPVWLLPQVPCPSLLGLG